jgi:hypothetical protein
LQQNIVELRQYTLQPGKRDTLIDLCDGHFIEPQETAGMSLIGQFRDVNNPERFVSLRGFPDMEARAAGLQSFYGGPVCTAPSQTSCTFMLDCRSLCFASPFHSVP